MKLLPHTGDLAYYAGIMFDNFSCLLSLQSFWYNRHNPILATIQMFNIVAKPGLTVNYVAISHSNRIFSSTSIAIIASYILCIIKN